MTAPRYPAGGPVRRVARFLETLGIALTRGRDFQEADGSAVEVSQSLANMFWPRRNAVGQSLPLRDSAFPGLARVHKSTFSGDR